MEVALRGRYLNCLLATLLTDLQTALGPLGLGEFYQINTAILTVGSGTDDYATSGGAGHKRAFGEAADKAASLMGCKSPAVNCLVRTASISGAWGGNKPRGARK